MVAHPTTPYPDLGALTGRLDEVSRPGHNRFVDAAALATGLFGDSTTANILLLGVAVQAGAIAVSPPAIERAIELNGVAVARNVAAFRWGRRWTAFPAEVEQAAGIATAPAPETTDELIDRLAAELVAYQDERYARRFLDLVGVARQAESRVDPSSTAFTAAVARFGFQLMAYKDEYEVARLLLAPEARAAYEAVGGPGTKVTWRLHPPMLRAAGMKQKMKLGPRTKPVLATLARSKRLRGTLADPFRWAEVRKLERAMVPEYERAVARLAGSLRATNLAAAVEIVSLPDQVRGYEHLKLARATAYRAELAERLASFP
jgi:indolepyruvate ferredoxin oxidoreductase